MKSHPFRCQPNLIINLNNATQGRVFIQLVIDSSIFVLILILDAKARHDFEMSVF